jgi:hypothetical protein
MFAFLSRRFRRWLVVAVAVPLVAWLLDRAGGAVERRRPGSRAGRTLRQTGGWLRGSRRGHGRRTIGW